MEHQLSFFSTETNDPIVNVASVPKRSPFRYPGGKTWLVPRVRQWLTTLPRRPSLFIEPFAGGASIGLTVGCEHLADHVLLVELDEDVAAVWQTILGEPGEAEALAELIMTFELSEETARNLLAQEPTSLRERAFQTVVKNRVNRGGILAPGAGLIKQGEAGKGIRSRWYPETLCKRILQIAGMRDRFTFLNTDGLTIVQRYVDDPNVLFFIDPPYTASGKGAGSRLYRHSELDHEFLFATMSRVNGRFLMTYDNAVEVIALAERFQLDTRAVPMKNTHHAKMTELLVSRDLSWM